MSRLTFTLLALSFFYASAQLGYNLPDGAETILRARSFTETFSCDGQPYGYYADVDNACQIFHICLPVTNEAGDVNHTARFSFFCPNQTVFSQESLSCTHEDSALPCDQASGLYQSSNADFGIIPDNVVQ
ncbi:UNVERIFIED_CONTAM: hypothetical protein GTU68_056303 [Idotea baltica]|nr:hypothetical protein [Idotea baltica]